LSGRGSLLGSRLAATHIRSTSVRAITIIDSTLRAMQRTDFLRATLGDPDLARAYMRQLARRLEVARHLSEVCSSPSAGSHILGVLHTVADVFGVESNGTSSVPIPSTLLERMTGTPNRIIEVTLRELRSHGIVELERDTIRWVM
jgi:CRP-like cAMP-binding protein